MLNQKMPRNIIMYQKIHYGLGVPKAKSNISPLKVGIEDTISITPQNNKNNQIDTNQIKTNKPIHTINKPQHQQRQQELPTSPPRGSPNPPQRHPL